MITGINCFREQFKDMEDQYAIIGGTACDLLMSEAGKDFRATKDFDIVLIIESLTPEFGKQFWDYILKAGYEHKNKSTGNPQFYRFSHPVSSEYPFMIKQFLRKSDFLNSPSDVVLTPLPIDDEISSLSAILLDDNYYEFIKGGMVKIDGTTIIDALHLIPLKARAWSDLSDKKEHGTIPVDSKDIKKHKNDIYRLTTLLSAEMQISVAKDIYDDLQLFIDAIKSDDISLKNIGIRMTSQDIIARLKSAYTL